MRWSKTGLGQDSHRFGEDWGKPLLLGGIIFENLPGLSGNSDADVVLHAITNAISGITGYNILGTVADRLCHNGITDSRVYLAESMKFLNGWEPVHVSLSIECLRPKISPRIDEMKNSIAGLLNMASQDISITATSGEGLTDFGRGLGIQVFCVLTALSPIEVA